nr:immunoglobulin light chain junction region [Macaca mulatta]
CASYAGSNVLF